MRRFPKFIFTFFLFCAAVTDTSATEPDSLMQVLKLGALEQQAMASAALSSFYRNSDSDSAIYYAKKGVDLAENGLSRRALVHCYRVLGESYMAIDSLDAAHKYYLEAQKHFTSEADSDDMILIYRKLGTIHAIRQEYYQAMNYNMRGLELAQKKNNKSAISKFYNNMGVIEGNVGLNKEALEHYRIVLGMIDPDENSQRCGTIGNIGLIFFDQQEGDSAKYYFTKALEMAYELNDNYLISNMLINLGAVELDLLSNLQAAKENFNRALDAIAMMEKTNTHGSAALSRSYASMFLGQILVREKKYNEAEKYYKKAERLAESIPNNEILQHLYPKEASLAELRGKPEIATQYYRKYLQLTDETKKQEAQKNTMRMIFEQQKKYELELQKQDKQLLQEKLKIKELSYIILLVSIISLLILTIALARIFWLRAKRRTLEQELTLVHKEKIEQELFSKVDELDFKKRELSTFTLEIVRKNNLIKNIANRLNDIQNKSASPDRFQISNIAKDINREEQSKILKEFEIRFNEVHYDFYQRLSKKFPNLTAGDLRLCAFLRLHMTNKEISSITIQSQESLKTARYRLRKKLNLPREKNLVNYLANF